MISLPQRDLCRVLDNTVIAPDILRLRIAAPSLTSLAAPGQFVMVRVGTGSDPLLRRPFSIHAAARGELEILYKVVGRGTAILAAARVGDEIDLLGPLGQGFTIADTGPHLLVGGGMGIAPLYLLAQKILDGGQAGAVALLGARNAEELHPLVTLFTELGIETMTATDDGSLGHHGLVTDLLKAHQEAGGVYCCGPRPMMAGVAAICAERGWPCQVSMETMMACGIKACLGCTVEAAATNSKGGAYVHVCQDGPVFAAEEIKW